MRKINLITYSLILGLVLFVAACDDTTDNTTVANDTTNAENTAVDNTTDNTVAPTDNTAATTDEAEIEPGDIVTNPDNYIGKTVTVTGEVEKVFSKRAFLLDEEAVTGDKDLLVLSPDKTELNLEAIDDSWLNDGVKVTGKVVRMVTADVEKELGWDLDNELEVEYKDRPVIIAQTIAKR